MQISISEPNTNEVLYRKKYPADFIAEKGMEEADGIFTYRSGTIKFYECWFEGMHIFVADILPEESFSLLIETDTPVYIMQFCLEGQLECRFCAGLQNSMQFKARQNTFLRIPACSIASDLAKPVKTACIMLTERCYERLVAKSDRPELPVEITVSNIIPAMQMILDSITGRSYNTAMKRIFLESRVMELLFLQLEQHKPIVQNTYIRKHDIEKIELAKLIIEQNIKTPCSLIELAHKAGLNDFKLKKGFKELLGTTVFGYLHDLRMERARQMLVEEKRAVNDVSHEVGYKNSHHFTSAFKKKFGVLPSQLNKT